MTTTAHSVARLLRRSAIPDLALAAVIVTVIALMIVPLPTVVLDSLLAFNLVTSVSIVLLTLFIPDALHLASFPSLLLITTLLRVGLDVAATRLILLHANAGEVIRSFGRLVVGNNYVAGAVVFLVITIVQYVVIAKGGERVAEVGARFALDALPGRQISIDAELRAGAIDADEARRKRAQLHRESQFYGAMDGAMKFVKGDVIASIFIATINIFGGVAIGVFQRDMAVGDALKRYAILSIGNGLATQIPALLLATSAGILVTRVASEEADKSLGTELGLQLLSSPRALNIAGGFAVLLAVVPGLPLAPFAALGVLLFFAAHKRAQHLRLQPLPDVTQPLFRPSGRSAGLRFRPLVLPWSLETAQPEPKVGVRPEETSPAFALQALSEHVREQVFLNLGVPLPTCALNANPALPPGTVRLLIHELPSGDLQFDPNIGVSDALLNPMIALIQRRAGEFITPPQVQRLLSELESLAPDTVRQVVPKPVTLATLTEVLRRLVEERVSIRDLSSVLHALSLHAGARPDDAAFLTERVRAELRRSITQAIAPGAAKLPVIVLDPNIEDVIRSAAPAGAVGGQLALPPAAVRDMIAAVKRAVSEVASKNIAMPVVLAAPDIRRHVRRLIEAELAEVRVISPSEVAPGLVLETASVVTVSDL